MILSRNSSHSRGINQTNKPTKIPQKVGSCQKPVCIGMSLLKQSMQTNLNVSCVYSSKHDFHTVPFRPKV